MTTAQEIEQLNKSVQEINERLDREFMKHPVFVAKEAAEFYEKLSKATPGLTTYSDQAQAKPSAEQMRGLAAVSEADLKAKAMSEAKGLANVRPPSKEAMDSAFLGVVNYKPKKKWWQL